VFLLHDSAASCDLGRDLLTFVVMADPTNELQVLDEQPDRFAFFGWNNITIATWSGPPDAQAVTRLARVGERRLREVSTPLTDVHLVLGKITFPDAATREVLIAESRKAAPHLGTVAVVVGGEGFWASAIRGFITGVHVLVPGHFQLRLFGRVDELVDWLPAAHESKTGVSVPKEQLRAVLDQVHAHVRGTATRAA
jgi:hypothetical protein